ncbi:MAG: cytidylyltransferase [Bacteroidetes bacterium]|jgi:CMP-N-acetylneuraminic acid synthetase|nr:cytidylyltransferase [Bacteroidota bacterium]
MNILITICARGGSKGIPGKNIKPIDHKPLVAYSILCAKEFAKHHHSKLTLSTDDAAIRKAAAEFGLETTYTRGEELAGDTAGKIDVIKDILYYEEGLLKAKYDLVLDLDVTSPLRSVSDLNKAFKILMDDPECITLFSVNPANRNPYFNMVEERGDGYIHLSKKLEGTLLTRQSAPKVYDVNASFYFYKRRFFDLGLKSPITNATKVYVMDHICFDLDHPIDFEFMEYLIVNKKLDFDLA